MPDIQLILESERFGIITLLITLLCFEFFWFLTLYTEKRQDLKLKLGEEKFYILQRAIAVLFMGIIPTLIFELAFPWFNPERAGLYFNPQMAFGKLKWVLLLLAVLIPVIFFNAGSEFNRRHYPLIRKREWTKTTIFIYLAGWAFYLVSYELLFRGIMLNNLSHAYGPYTSIAITTAMYSATHIPKGAGETFGALVLGVLLAIITLSSGTIWYAVLIHLIMASTNSMRAFYKNPDMKLIHRK